MSRRQLSLRCALCGCGYLLTEDEAHDRGWRCLDRAGLFAADDALCGGKLVSRGEYRTIEQQRRKASRGAR